MLQENANRGMERRDFIRIAAKTVMAGMVLQIVGCSDSGTEPVDGRVGEIDGNHGHTVSITQAQIDAGVEVTLTFGGSADHVHTVTLTASDVATLKGGGDVHAKLSSSGGATAHTHTVHFM